MDRSRPLESCHDACPRPRLRFAAVLQHAGMLREVRRTLRDSRALRPGLPLVTGGEHYHRVCNCGHRWAIRQRAPDVREV